MHVDVVIPVYGHGHLVLEAIDSLAVQEIPLSVVVVDDGVDDLLAVCRPHEGRRAINQHVVELGAGRNVSKAYVEILGAFHVSRVGKQCVVW